MAFTRKFLSALGIEAEKIDEIMTAHVEVTDALKAEANKNKDAAEELEAITKERDQLKANAEKQNGEETVPKKDYDELQKQVDEYKLKEAHHAKETAYRDLLKAAGVPEKRMNAILKVSDIDGIELDKDGKVKGAEERTKNIKTEWADFIPTVEEKGADTATPPEGGASNTPNLGALSMDEYIKARMKG